MPLSCAKRGNLQLENNLDQLFSGLSTAFQQVLWKTVPASSQLTNRREGLMRPQNFCLLAILQTNNELQS
jgi:hypothetical protein